MPFNLNDFDVAKFDEILSRGLSCGLGDRDGRMCIEAAICTVLGLDHGDEPQCVAALVRRFKIRLNDSNWSSPAARAAGLRDLGLAQLGSLGVVDDKEFAAILSKKTIQILIPKLFREVFPTNQRCLDAAAECENLGTPAAAAAAARAARAARAAAAVAAWAAAERASAVAAAAAEDSAAAAEDSAASAAAAAEDSAASAVAAVAAAAARASASGDGYLLLMARLGLETLKELNSPGCALLGGGTDARV